MPALNQNAIALLNSVDLVDVNSATPTVLYTVPPGVKAIVTALVLRKSSVNLTTASVSVGWNSASFNDVLANATHTELANATVYVVLPAKAGAAQGDAGDDLELLANTLQGAPATISVDVFGYLRGA